MLARSSRYVLDLPHLVAVKALIMLINVRGRRRRHFVLLVAVRKSGVVVRVVVVMIDRAEIAVVGCVSLPQHVRSDEIRGLGVQRVGLR